MDANKLKADDQNLGDVPVANLTKKQKNQRKANSPAGVRARKKHMEKRVMRPISLNSEKESDQAILEVISAKEFSLTAWFRYIFEQYSTAETSLLKKGHYHLPATLVEKAIEEGFFDLDAYLESKGKKVVKIDEQHQEPVYYD